MRRRRVRNRYGLISDAPPWLSDQELQEMGLELLHEPEEPREEPEAQPEPEPEPSRPRRRR